MNRFNLTNIKLILFGVLIFITSCATQSTYKKTYTVQSEEQSVFVDSGLVILVLSPNIKYVSIINEKEVDYQENKGVLKNDIENHAIAILRDKGFILKSMKQISDVSESFNKELASIQDNSESMFKAFIDTGLQEKIKLFGEKSNTPAILKINCEAQVGSGGSWNSYTGQITTQNNRTILKAVLIRTSDCRKLWSNSTQLRELPKVESPNFEKAINSIFINLKSKRRI